MQILLSEAAHARVAAPLAAMSAGLDIITIDPAGTFKRAGVPVDAAGVDPEIFWVSLDLYQSGELPNFFRQMLRGTRGQWTQIFAAGIDNPVFARLMAKNIRISKNSAQGPAIAEYVLVHAFSLLHPIADYRAAQDARDWKYIRFREIGSTRWLMVGYGAIGQEIARRLQPFNAPLTIVRRNAAPEPLAASVRPTADFIGLLPDADVVVLACALNEETRGHRRRSVFQGNEARLSVRQYRPGRAGG